MRDVGEQQPERRRDAGVRAAPAPRGSPARAPGRRRASGRRRRTAKSANSRGSRPRSTVTTRSQRVMLALAMRMIPAAASSTSRPSRSPKRATASRARPTSRCRSPARPRSAERRPSTRFASVIVASRAAPPVGRRARHRAGALRPHLGRAGGVDPGDRAAARAHRHEVDGREADRQPELRHGLAGQPEPGRRAPSRCRRSCRRCRWSAGCAARPPRRSRRRR